MRDTGVWVCCPSRYRSTSNGCQRQPMFDYRLGPDLGVDAPNRLYGEDVTCPRTH